MIILSRMNLHKIKCYFPGNSMNLLYKIKVGPVSSFKNEAEARRAIQIKKCTGLIFNCNQLYDHLHSNYSIP